MSMQVRAAATINSQIKGVRGTTAIAIDVSQAEAAARALEKQIPMDVDMTVGDRIHTYGVCPVCGLLLSHWICVTRYCQGCGQRIKLPEERC